MPRARCSTLTFLTTRSLPNLQPLVMKTTTLLADLTCTIRLVRPAGPLQLNFPTCRLSASRFPAYVGCRFPCRSQAATLLLIYAIMMLRLRRAGRSGLVRSRSNKTTYLTTSVPAWGLCSRGSLRDLLWRYLGSCFRKRATTPDQLCPAAGVGS